MGFRFTPPPPPRSNFLPAQDLGEALSPLSIKLWQNSKSVFIKIAQRNFLPLKHAPSGGVLAIGAALPGIGDSYPSQLPPCGKLGWWLRGLIPYLPKGC